MLADGYTDPVLTAQRFVPDPHAGVPGAVMYHTGDRARFWPCGTLEFLGRLDGQIKIRGHRIERGEIETVLGEHPAVSACVVLPRADARRDARLCAWYVPREGAAVTVGDLRAHVAAKVPDYMVPQVFVALEGIPTTANGKLDPSRLPDPEGQRPALATAFVDPRDELEALVARVWCEVLELERVGARDNFFELGGHSAAMLHVQHALEEALGRSVPIVDLFHHSSVDELARHLAAPPEPAPEPDDGGQGRRELARRNRERRRNLLKK